MSLIQGARVMSSGSEKNPEASAEEEQKAQTDEEKQRKAEETLQALTKKFQQVSADKMAGGRAVNLKQRRKETSGHLRKSHDNVVGSADMTVGAENCCCSNHLDPQLLGLACNEAEDHCTYARSYALKGAHFWQDMFMTIFFRDNFVLEVLDQRVQSKLLPVWNAKCR